MTPTPRRFRAPDGSPPRRERQEIAALLAEGGVVALPTETVYGLAVRADDASAVARLREIKGRDPRIPLTWHVGSLDPLERVTELTRCVRRLAERYWPGPLTLVVRARVDELAPIADGDWLGIRLPAHTGTAELLRSLDFPVAATSANRSGEPPLCDPDAVERELGAEIDALVDGGPTRMREASAVLRIGRGTFEVLREGLLGPDALRRTAGLRIGFACTGNTCRSPMAEGVARAVLAELLGTPEIGELGFEVASMGVAATAGAPASAHGVRAMQARGVDISGHVSRPATIELVGELDVVYGLTRSHVEALRALLPPKRAAAVTLLDPEGTDVPDPIGGTLEDYERCAERIRDLVVRRAAEWV